MIVRHHSEDLTQLFNNLFTSTEQTVLIAGGEEPIYLPKDDSSPYHRIIFTKDYYASALHEIAHWCIAGKERRLLVDYGYWYAPDGRDVQQQKSFEHAETKPQALEWIFSTAAGFKFHLSRDNLSSEPVQDNSFALNVQQQVNHYLTHRMPSRAKQFQQALLEFYSK